MRDERFSRSLWFAASVVMAIVSLVFFHSWTDKLVAIALSAIAGVSLAFVFMGLMDWFDNR